MLTRMKMMERRTYTARAQPLLPCTLYMLVSALVLMPVAAVVVMHIVILEGRACPLP